MDRAAFPQTDRRGPLVLVADDDRDTRELYRACFDTSGYRTGEAETGSQAIAAAVELLPDVLLTDYVLTDLDGLTVARRLKADARTAFIRILLVTAYDTPDLKRRAALAGIERVLFKPCLPQAMLREVARSLSRQAPHAQLTESRRSTTADRRNEPMRDEAIARIREEFVSLPGLTLTAEQARLVFDLDRAAVERILGTLVVEGFLARTQHGSFKRLTKG